VALLTGEPTRPLLALDAADVPQLLAQLRSVVTEGSGLPVLPLPAERMPQGAPIAGPLLPDGIALVIETSGSTAAPKRVALSAEALVASADATHDALGGPGRWLLALPAHYIAGAQVLVRSIVAGTEPVVLGPGAFDPAAFAAASARLDARTPRYTSLVPVQLRRVVEAAERDPFIAAALVSYDAVLVGGQAVPPDVVDRAAALGARVIRTYGSSETAGGCVYDGRPLDGVQLRTVAGAIEVSGPMLAEGYLDQPERTAAAFTIDDRGSRWYRTGDLGAIDADGVLRVTGRADDVITSGGVKVVLGEVERAVHSIAGFGDAIAVAVADPVWGERVAIVTATASEASPASDPPASHELTALRSATDAAGLPPAARPVRVVRVRDLPRLASGKPDRVAASALARAAVARDADAPG
jgi:O-succinylbenzoic acid--CoA ligase